MVAALMATRLGPDGWAVAGLAVELTGPLQQVQQQRHGLLEVLTALPAAGRPHPLEDLQSARQEYLRALPPGSGLPRPGGRPAAATRRRRALSRLQPVTEQTPRRHPSLVLLRRLRAPARRTSR